MSLATSSAESIGWTKEFQGLKNTTVDFEAVPARRMVCTRAIPQAGLSCTAVHSVCADSLESVVVM